MGPEVSKLRSERILTLKERTDSIAFCQEGSWAILGTFGPAHVTQTEIPPFVEVPPWKNCNLSLPLFADDEQMPIFLTNDGIFRLWISKKAQKLG